MKKILTVIALVLILAGCNIHNPSTTVSSLDDRPSISLSGAPKEAVLYVDGLAYGDANQYNGAPKVLRLEPGTHLVEVKTGASVIYRQNIFIESGIKQIKIH